MHSVKLQDHNSVELFISTMKILSKFYLLAFTIFLLNACKKSDSDIPTKQLNHTSSISTDLSVPSSLIVSGEYFIVTDLMGTDNVIIYGKDGKIKAKAASKGDSSTEVLEASNVELQNIDGKDILNVYDLEKGKILTYDLKALISSEKEIPTVKNIESENRYYNVCKLSKGYAALGMFEDHKFDILDDSTKLLGKYGEYLPNKNDATNAMVNASANFGKSVVSPNCKLLVNVTYAAGVLRFYNIDGNKLKHVKDAVICQMNYKVKGDDYVNESGMGFLSAAISKKYVYAIYSGEKEDVKSPVPSGKYVYKYDYSGNLINKYELDNATFSIAVAPDDSRLYTIADNKGYCIYTYSMKDL